MNSRVGPPGSFRDLTNGEGLFGKGQHHRFHPVSLVIDDAEELGSKPSCRTVVSYCPETQFAGRGTILTETGRCKSKRREEIQCWNEFPHIRHG